MSASLDVIWHPLPSSLENKSEPLLIRYSFTKDGYKVQVTDLSQVWTEELKKKQIIKRALNDDVSIDPSEDDSQFDILLQKLKDAIHGEKDTSIDIQRTGSGKELRIIVSSKLPHPLKPLRWTLHLVRNAEANLSTEFIMPLLRSSSLQYQRVEELARLLAEKDDAIYKMLDKVESIGVDWSALFPNVGNIRSSRREKRREYITKNVRGMQTFNKKEWVSSFTGRDIDANNLHDLIRDAFAGGSAVNNDNVMESIEPSQLRYGSLQPETKARDETTPAEANSDDDNDFQVRFTIDVPSPTS